MINIDFLVAGCNTRCRHCYVNGGPGPMMSLDNVLLCLERLDLLAARLPGEVSFTLDHEPMNHPYIQQIISAAAGTQHIQNFHHGMTTGLALMGRKDRAEIVRAYVNQGYDSFGITLHGIGQHHDEITCHKGSFDAAISAAKYVKAQGESIDVTLMLNRFFSEDAKSITRLLQEIEPDYIGFVIPIFTPHRNMLNFESYRATTAIVEKLAGHLTEWGQDETTLLDSLRQHTVSAGIEWLQENSLSTLFSQRQDELYLTLHPDCLLYVGNSGAETQCLGDLRDIDLDGIAEMIRSLPGNRDYGAFYDVNVLPSPHALLEVLTALPQDLLYGDFPSILYRGLVEMGVPTKLIF